jgi:dihydropyrimidinase
MSVLIKGGRIVTAADDYVGDVFVDGERIAMIGESLDVDADRVVPVASLEPVPRFAGIRRDDRAHGQVLCVESHI